MEFGASRQKKRGHFYNRYRAHATGRRGAGTGCGPIIVTDRVHFPPMAEAPPWLVRNADCRMTYQFATRMQN
jgi:hypothetical protein